ncbi:hypothetical protein LIER_42411 [Lithospermum erythrorhizon]|uniref:Uncharacterized protein n=1 Tax=Lithospermum erythrorhizon TaxID=34254 RepID=A0AAV3RRG7_LITER
MADKRRGCLFHMSSSSSYSSSEGNEQHYHKEEIVVEEEHQEVDFDVNDDEDDCHVNDDEDHYTNDEEEEDEFGLEAIGAGELIPLMKEFKVLCRKIRNLLETTSLKNPLYRVLKDIQDLGRMIVELDQEYDGPENIVTSALRNGIRPESRLQMEQLSKDHSVAKVQPNPRKGKYSEAIDTLIEIVVNSYYPNIERSKQLLGNFAPVREETIPFEAFMVKGRIPETLNGMMVRNGPNPVFEPVAHYYW